MSVENFKSEILRIIDSWTANNTELLETKIFLTQTQVADSLKEILNTNFGVGAFDNNLSGKLDVFNETSIPEQRNALLSDASLLMDMSEEICKSGQNFNATVSGENEMGEKQNSKENDKTAASPVIFINDVGRSDTFELKSPNVTNNSAPSVATKTRIDGTSYNSKKSQELVKKLEKAQRDISTIEKTASIVLAEINGIKMQLQEDANKFAVPEKRSSKISLASVTPFRRVSSLKRNPKVSSSSPRRSNSFSAVKEEKKLMAYSPNTSSICPSPATRKRSFFSSSMSVDMKDNPIPKNPKYAHVQSTIPKVSRDSKRTAK